MMVPVREESGGVEADELALLLDGDGEGHDEQEENNRNGGVRNNNEPEEPRVRERWRLLQRSTKEVPDELKHLCCPITMAIMKDPVSCPAGHNFEREAIEAWLEAAPTHPLTRVPLRSDQLVPNEELRLHIIEHVRNHLARADEAGGGDLTPMNLPEAPPQIPDLLRTAVTVASRRGRSLDRNVAIMGVVSTGKSSLQKGLLFECGYPLRAAVADEDTRAILAATRTRFDRAHEDQHFFNIPISAEEGTTTQAHRVPLNPTTRTNHHWVLGRWNLVDVPGLGLSHDHHSPGDGDPELRRVTADTIMQEINKEFDTLDAVIVAIDKANDVELFNLCERALEALRAKNKVKPGSERWYDAINRLFVVRTKPDVDLVDGIIDCDIKNPTTWLKNRVSSDPRIVSRIESYVDRAADRLMTTLNELEGRLARDHNYSPRLLELEDVKRLFSVVSTHSMRYKEPDEFCRTYLCADFGVPELLQKIHTRLTSEDAFLVLDELGNDVVEINGKLKTGVITGSTLGGVIALAGMITWVVPPVGAAWTIACGIGLAVTATATGVAGGVLQKQLDSAKDLQSRFTEQLVAHFTEQLTARQQRAEQQEEALGGGGGGGAR